MAVWLIFRVSDRAAKFEAVRNALILGTFPQILHLLFIIWDYPRNDQFDSVINIITFTSHFSALSSMCSNYRTPVLAVILGNLVAIQLKKQFLIL